eukprot:scaffold10123_cov117-Isochrysis_galbana.AAC.3
MSGSATNWLGSGRVRVGLRAGGQQRPRKPGRARWSAHLKEERWCDETESEQHPPAEIRRDTIRPAGADAPGHHAPTVGAGADEDKQ